MNGISTNKLFCPVRYLFYLFLFAVSDPWLLNGIYDYYLSTDSERVMEILANITEPHCTYLFDR